MGGGGGGGDTSLLPSKWPSHIFFDCVFSIKRELLASKAESDTGRGTYFRNRPPENCAVLLVQTDPVFHALY